VGLMFIVGLFGSAFFFFFFFIEIKIYFFLFIVEGSEDVEEKNKVF